MKIFCTILAFVSVAATVITAAPIPGGHTTFKEIYPANAELQPIKRSSPPVSRRPVPARYQSMEERRQKREAEKKKGVTSKGKSKSRKGEKDSKSDSEVLVPGNGDRNVGEGSGGLVMTSPGEDNMDNGDGAGTHELDRSGHHGKEENNVQKAKQKESKTKSEKGGEDDDETGSDDDSGTDNASENENGTDDSDH